MNIEETIARKGILATSDGCKREGGVQQAEDGRPVLGSEDTLTSGGHEREVARQTEKAQARGY